MDGESTAFRNQVLEVDRAIEKLAKSGRLYQARNQVQQPPSHFNAPPSSLSSRYSGPAHYASQRHSSMNGPRGYGTGRISGATYPGVQGYADINTQYYAPPPPPLQQQYSHSQQQGQYPVSNSMSAYGQLLVDADGSQYAGTRCSIPDQSRMYVPSSMSPFGDTMNSMTPLSRLNTGGATSSSQSTTPSLTGGMSSSTSMLPPGHGRENFAPASNVSHTRAHSVTGLMSGLPSTGRAYNTASHSRAQSINHGSESIRHMPGESMSPTASAVFSPLAGHSRTASISIGLSGSPSSPGPASPAAFNFFSPPTAPSNSSGHTTYCVSSSAVPGGSRIAAIGRPGQSRSMADTSGSSRARNQRASGTGPSSSAASGVTSPLSNGFTDGWLDQVASTTQNYASNMGESQLRSLQSVWND